MNERTQVAKASDWLWSAVAHNPESLLLLAAGGVLLMRNSAPAGSRVGERSRHTYDMDRRTGPDLSSIRAEAGNAAGSMAASATKYAREASRATTEGTNYIMRQAQATFGSGLDRALNEQPLLVVLGGFAAGAAIAAALPTSNVEKQALGPVGAQFSEEAARFGDQLKDTASKAAGTLKTAVQEHGLDAEGVRKIVSEVTEVVRDGMQTQPQRQAPKATSSPRSDWDRGE
jgi:hypothetical protein